jgi:hypothetical protein
MLAVAVAVAAPAAADTGDTGGGDAQLLQIIKLHIAGINNPTEGDAGLIKGGKAICDAMSSGRSRDSIRQQLEVGQNAWSDSDARWFITASAVAYCPDFIETSDRW